MALSDAIGQERISKIVGYILKKGNFRESSPNLPQRIAIFAEANEANQVDLDTNGTEITSAKRAGDLYGYGSPIHSIMRILRPSSGDGVGGIPTIVYAQAQPDGATSKQITVTPVGVATGNGTHYLIIAGRNIIDGVAYAINIVSGDTVADITQKIEDAVNAALSSPMTGASTEYLATLESKWNGLTADGLTVTVDRGDDDLGLTYTIDSVQSGSGTPSVQAALDQFGNEWNTIVINSYGIQSTTLDLLEAFNGIPQDVPTGRYTGTTFKPFIAITGSTSDDPSASTDSRDEDVTIAIAPAPGSAGLQYEAAANMAYLFALQAQNSPHLDVSGQSYPDMPTPETVAEVGSMTSYNNRDAIVKKGCSTVDLKSGRYEVQDFVTTYHPDGEVPPQFRYCRNLNLDWNVRYGYFLLEAINVVDHAIANNEDIVSADNTVKPMQWIQILNSYSDDLANRALIVNPDFMKDSLEVAISTVNPDRFETFFRYKRSGFVRQSATTAEAGFNFGTI